MSRANRRAENEPVDDLATRWREVGRLIESIDSELFATMVRTWEVTAVALANARRGAQ